MEIKVNTEKFNGGTYKVDRGASQKITGFASIDRPWLKYYQEGAYEKANELPQNKTLWDVIEEKLFEYYDVPAIEYFKKQFSRKEFRETVYVWARTFRSMGISENEIVPVYGPFFPDICAMTFALNLIGATPYFLKLSISHEALVEETAEAKIAIVYDGMWNNVKNVFQDAHFKKIIVVSATDAMIRPKKEILKFINYIEFKKNNSLIPNTEKYLRVDEAIKMAKYYTGEVKVPFENNRSAFITSSSGTTINGIVKGTIATNESAIAQLFQADAAKVNYIPGKKCLTNFPPTASTSLNCLFFLPLYKGMLLVNDPRVDKKHFCRQLDIDKPSVVISTGSMWEEYFRHLEEEIKKGKFPDLSHADMWIIGGEGTNPKYLAKWNELMNLYGAPNPIFSGYGLSEVFSVSSVDSTSIFTNEKPNDSVIGVGIPYPGIEVGVFDNEGNELPYNERGELRIRSRAIMKEYYNKPELTNKVIEDNWLKTGDLFSINEEGHLFCWGRITDKIKLKDNKEVYLFDVSNIIKQHPKVMDCIVNLISNDNNQYQLVAHIVFEDELIEEDKVNIFKELDDKIKEVFSEEISIIGYKEHPMTIKYSPTTLKKDRNALMRMTDGYIKVAEDTVYDISIEEGYNVKRRIRGNNKCGI